MHREQAYNLVKKYLHEEKLVKHSLAVEAIMRAVALETNKDPNLWSVTGLLHDLDYEYTKDFPDKHATVTCQILDGILPEKAINAIKAHNYKHTEYIPSTSIDKALIASDAISGLIIASALVMPSKKLSEVRYETLVKKFKDSSFAQGVNRKRIELCIDAGIELENFLKISLKALQDISDKLDL